MDEAEVVAMFQDPEKLLRRCYLHITGGATRSAQQPNAPLPPGNGQAIVATFKLKVSEHNTAHGVTRGGKAKERPMVDVIKLPGAANLTDPKTQIDAYYIPMVQTSDVGGGMSHYTLPDNGGPDIMVTSKLTGCVFGIGTHSSGAVLVSHVQPNSQLAKGQGKAGMETRQQDLTATMWQGFEGHRMTNQFQFGHEYTDSAAVIGKRTGGQWRFYLQQASGIVGDYTLGRVVAIE
jgi:hypothetical protein